MRARHFPLQPVTPMNARIRLAATLALAALCALPAPLALAAGEPSAPPAESPAPRPVRDPFSIGAVSPQLSSYAPASGSAQSSADVELKGVFIVEGRPPAALVRSGGERSTLVRVGDVFPVYPRQDSRTGRPLPAAAASLRQLRVTAIGPDNITVAPPDRPGEALVIR